MGFYDLSKNERQKVVIGTEGDILQAIHELDIHWNNNINPVFVPEVIINYASDSDTYVRKKCLYGNWKNILGS
jgi:hypothetical protein